MKDTEKRREVGFEAPLSETALLTLFLKAQETLRPDRLLEDPKAVEILEKLDVDLSRFKDKRMSQVGTVIRTRRFDRQTRRILSEWENPIGFQMAKLWGSEVHDEIIWDEANGYTRRTNSLGGLEGGMTTGMPIVVRGVMKPIPTLYKPLESVDIHTKEPFVATIERSDPCAVPAASVVAEHVIATEMAKAIIEQYHSDTMGQLKRQVEEMRTRGKEF